MSAWRHQAFERFPEFRTKLQESKSPGLYWIELQLAFNEAYRKGDIDLFKRILDYADWCFKAHGENATANELGTIVWVFFFEHMPQISMDYETDQIALGRELLAWNGPTITHPHVRALLQNLVDRKKKDVKPKGKNS